MASPAAKAVEPPKTLPPDFFDKQGAQDTLPANFDFGDKAPEQPQGNALQRAFDTATTVTPEQEKGHSWLTNKAQEFGAGAIGTLSPLVHPMDTLEGMGHTIAHPIDSLHADVDNARAHPAQFLGGLAGSAALGGAAGELGEAALAKLPSTTRAASTLNRIESQAANTPVNFQNTEPALQKFGEHVATGGKGAGVMSKLSNRISPSTPKLGLLDTMQNELNGVPPPAPPAPVKFPEARDFYTNVSNVTKEPGFLRRAFEDSSEPRLRYAAGPVREGMNADLTESLKPLNLDQDYTGALKEYARGKALQTGLRRARTAAIGTAAGAAGLGKLHGIASSVLR